MNSINQKPKPVNKRKKTSWKGLSSAGKASDRQANFGKPIVLVGMMGVGKSTIGKRLAARLNMSFVDVDDEITISANMEISDIFERHGESHFRNGERKVIQRLLDGEEKVIATGGGAFIETETREIIMRKAITVWLYADLDILVERVSRRDTRPLLRNGDPTKIITDLSKIRNPIYALAQYHVRTDDAPHEKTTIKIIKALSK